MVLVPEGIVEFIDEMSALITEINAIFCAQLKDNNLEVEVLLEKIKEYLTVESRDLLTYLPQSIAE